MIKMKIGVLTFLMQQNYGGVLQSFALQKKLKDLGHNVEVLRIWLSKNNSSLRSFFQDERYSFIKRFYHFFRHILRRDCVFSDYIRKKRTQMFIEKYISTSPREYRCIEELVDLAKYDCLIVGSDQVWSLWDGKPGRFLVESMDTLPIPKIAYAASMGVSSLPFSCAERLNQALASYKKISCRERSAAEIARNLPGAYNASWVVDPVLLLSRLEWENMVKKRHRSYYCCYWLGDIGVLATMLGRFLQKYHHPVHLFLRNQNWENMASLAFQRELRLLPKNVRVSLCSGPREFITELANSIGVITDSFHGMMFAIIFGKPLRVIIQSDPVRLQMSGRMQEFADKVGLTNVISNSIDDDLSLSDGNYTASYPLIDQWRNESLQFLTDALASVKI